MLSCNTIIDEFIAANYWEGEGARHRHAMRQVLYALVRQAKAEQLADIRKNAERALRVNGKYVRASRLRQLRREAGASVQARLSQRELEFGARSDCDSLP
ncbi:MAG TPA: hypothetical protein VFT37_06070 [Telluria sp.]|nr:hypothetical protein [Telluria sp.]